MAYRTKINLTMILILSIFFLLLAQDFGLSQDTPFATLPRHLNNQEYADWITHPNINGNEYGVYYFRKEFDLKALPKKFVINISADNRYKLFVNEQYITFGPAAGDLNNWNYEKLDISNYLHEGNNIIAVQVWNWGEGKGPRQISARTAFILQGEGEIETVANSNSTWRVISDPSYSPIVNTERTIRQGYIAGVSEKIDGKKHLWSWYRNGDQSIDWQIPLVIGKGASQGLNTWMGITPWILKERSIPLMEEKVESIPKICYIKGVEFEKEEYDGRLKIKIPKKSRVEILLDNNVLTMGYPSVICSGGKNSRISIKYQEALFNEDGSKGNRNDWEGKELKGVEDIYFPDGGDYRKFEPLWIRIFRYIKITIETDEDELLIDDFHSRFTAYPLHEKAFFRSNDAYLSKIWDASWRTVRLCALETYMDCPYYEQLQYIGDTRIQALISTYIAGETRLFRNAIDQFNNSIQPMGLTKSAHPTEGIQIIPPFSLVYILMIHDYLMLSDDPHYINKYIPSIEFILSWFIKKIDETGMIGPLPYWNHIDGGAEGFNAGSPPGIDEGNSAHMSILLAYTLDKSIEIFDYFDMNEKNLRYKDISDRLKKSVNHLCYDSKKGLFAETPKKEIFSQHTNSFAILAELRDEKDNYEIGKKLLDDMSLIKTTLYFDFYKFEALKKAGLGDKIIDEMGKWIEFLDVGLTTFPEHGIESRSDCHAWAAHPMYDFLNITSGIESTEPGFKSISISPNPGKLKMFHSSMPHPYGAIKINYNKTDEMEKFEIEIPEGLNSMFTYKNLNKELRPGTNNIRIGGNK